MSDAPTEFPNVTNRWLPPASERTDRMRRRQSSIDRLFLRFGGYLSGQVSGLRGNRAFRIVPKINARSMELRQVSDVELRQLAVQAGRLGRRLGLDHETFVAQAFALVSESAARTLDLRHRDVQLAGGYAMLRGHIAEMQTGEGKSLTATLTAASAALAGWPVHIVTVNDYLAERDASHFSDLYGMLGLAVAAVTETTQPAERLRNYRAAITYCTGKELTFDYLRDRQNGFASRGPIECRLGQNTASAMLPFLGVGIIDEIDSILIDEARTPLVLSSEAPPVLAPATLKNAAELAETLLPDVDYQVRETDRTIELTEQGRTRIAAAGADAAQLRIPVLREELVVKALTAEHFFHRDEHYIVRSDKVEIVDEYTGRASKDRFWTSGLHEFVERKEGIAPSSGRVSLARTTYQKFFNRYGRLCGMSGTVREAAPELLVRFGLPVAAIRTYKPSRRQDGPADVCNSESEKWSKIARHTQKVTASGAPVLIGTRSVNASMAASQALRTLGLDHTVLSAMQNEAEAKKIAGAGQTGQITIATNMAGRGADIEIDDAARNAGGLTVIMSEFHDSRRIDRQLAGRAGRQSEPGVFLPIVSKEDPILIHLPLLLTWMKSRFCPIAIRRAAFRIAQMRAEMLHARTRRDLNDLDQRMDDAYGFTKEER